MMFASDNQAFESPDPRESPLYYPSRAVSSPHPLLLSSLPLPVTSMRREQNNASLFQTLPQRITVVSFVGNYSFGPCFRSSSPCARHSNGVQGFFLQALLPLARQIQGCLPKEYPCHRPPPSTSFPYPAWSYRLLRPFFCRNEAAVHECFFPVKEPSLVKL